jgi:hypothetical protein
MDQKKRTLEYNADKMAKDFCDYAAKVCRTPGAVQSDLADLLDEAYALGRKDREAVCKASSKNEEWMKSTKALEIDGLGCVVQVTTQQCHHVAEAVCFVPGVRIVDDEEFGGRKLVKF